MDTVKYIESDEFRSMAAKSLDGFLVVDMTGDILEANASYCRMMGYSREELIKRHISEIDAVESEEDVSKRVAELINDGALRFKTRHIHKNGSIIDVEVSSTYSHTHGGTFYSFIRNITEHKRYEIALRQSEEQYRNIVENQTEFVDRYLPGGILTYVNKSLVKFAGIPEKMLLGTSFYSFLHDADRAETIRRIESISGDNPIVETESRIVLPDGRVRWNRWTHTGFFDEIGKLIECQSVGRDITERREARFALEESESRYRTLFHEAGEGICIMSLHGELIQVNEAFAQNHGYKIQEMVGMNICDLDVHGGFEENPERGQAILSGETITFEVEHYHKDGHVFPLEAKASQIPIDGETLYICFHRDISERIQAEKERKLLEQQFQQAQKLESLGVLAGGIAHDFNNILAIIMGYCGLTKMDFETAENNILEIEKAVQRAAALCRQMLAYAGQTTIEHLTVDMNMVVDEMVKMLQTTIAQNVVVMADLSSNVPYVTGDVSQLRQVVMNLIINSAEAIGAYSDPNRPPFRRDTGHHSGVNPAGIPIRLRPLFRCNPASVK